MTVFSSAFACVIGAIWTAKAFSALPAESIASLAALLSRTFSRLALRS
jgi:hypothetical protein